MIDEFSLILIVVSFFVVAAIAFIAGLGFSQSWNYDQTQGHINTDEEDLAVLWNRIGEHITNGSLYSEEAQAMLDKVGREGWFGRLASAGWRHRMEL